MDALLTKLTESILKDKLSEDVEQLYERFRKTKEFKEVIEQAIKEKIADHVDLFCEDTIEFDTVITPVIIKLLKTPSVSQIMEQTLTTYIKDNHVIEDIIEEHDGIKDTLAQFLSKELDKKLKK